jgi:heterotetrameric sarcosine oxidase delta subunit
MGFQIDCPNCGPRSYHEYWFGGERRPYNVDDDAETDYVSAWLRENRAGPHQEQWFHFAGCRRWLTVERDTRTNLTLRIWPSSAE